MIRTAINQALANEYASHIAANERQLAQALEFKARLYENLVTGTINKEEYTDYKAKYTRVAENAKEAIRALKDKLSDVLENRSERNRWISHFTQFSTMETLDRKAVVHMIQSIKVIGKKELEITFTYQDEYQKATTADPAGRETSQRRWDDLWQEKAERNCGASCAGDRYNLPCRNLCALSVEDKHTRTASIETQQLIIARYLEQNPEIIVVQTYIDNGATGTNFHRPGFQQMLSDIEAGLINCIIVKDLSPPGAECHRHWLLYRTVFSHTRGSIYRCEDRYDSSSPDHAHDGIIIPLQNMINEAYALDIAKKIKAQQRQAMKDGKYVGARTPYGYLKAPDDCHQLIIDPVAAEVVKTMFQWAAEGDGLNTIAVRLNEAGVLSPSHYKKKLGEITHENLIGNGNWQTRTVAKILRAEVYAGDLVQGISKVIDHKQVRASADEWTVVRDTHEAIVSRELFDAVQKALDRAAQQAKDREIHSWSPNLLRGKIFCAHCGHSLHRQKCVRKKTPDVYVYHCISNNRIKKGACPGTFIFEKELLDALADMIQEQLDTTLGQYSIGLESLSKEAEEQKSIQAKITSRKQEIQQLRTYQRGLYEGLIQNHLSQDEYFAFKEKYEAKIEEISEEIEQLKAGLTIIARQLEQYKMLSQDAQHIKEDRQLTAALIDRLIERVEVSREKQITVHFRFQSEFEHGEEVLNQCRNM